MTVIAYCARACETNFTRFCAKRGDGRAFSPSTASGFSGLGRLCSIGSMKAAYSISTTYDRADQMDRHNGGRAAKELPVTPHGREAWALGRGWHRRLAAMAIALDYLGSPTPELVANRRALRGRAPLLLVSKHQPTLLQVIRRHFDSHAIAGQRLDAI